MILVLCQNYINKQSKPCLTCSVLHKLRIEIFSYIEIVILFGSIFTIIFYRQNYKNDHDK